MLDKRKEKLNEGLGSIDNEHGITEWNRAFTNWSVAVWTIPKAKVPRTGFMSLGGMKNVIKLFMREIKHIKS